MLTGILKQVCSWCGEQYGTKPCEPELDGQTTHGICEACASKWRANKGASK